MKATTGAGISQISGKIGNLSAQIRNGKQTIGKASIPYSKSGEQRSTAQNSINQKYGDAVGIWQALSIERKEFYNELADTEKLSGENMIVKLRVEKARYGTARYRISTYRTT